MGMKSVSAAICVMIESLTAEEVTSHWASDPQVKATSHFNSDVVIQSFLTFMNIQMKADITLH